MSMLRLTGSKYCDTVYELRIMDVSDIHFTTLMLYLLHLF